MNGNGQEDIGFDLVEAQPSWLSDGYGLQGPPDTLGQYEEQGYPDEFYVTEEEVADGGGSGGGGSTVDLTVCVGGTNQVWRFPATRIS